MDWKKKKREKRFLSTLYAFQNINGIWYKNYFCLFPSASPRLCSFGHLHESNYFNHFVNYLVSVHTRAEDPDLPQISHIILGNTGCSYTPPSQGRQSIRRSGNH